MDVIILLAAALALDLVAGEPPLPVHPVVWMGKFTYLWEKAGLPKKPALQLAYGTIMTLVTVGVFAAPVYFLLSYLQELNYSAYLIVGAVLFKITFSLKELRKAALNIKNLLLAHNLDGARLGLRSLVKRDSRDLSEPLVISATIESVAENICDSFVAPLFYFLLLGVPGAMAYRVINTLDAMIGRHGQYEYLGKFAARLDDAANIIPSRITALLIVLAAFLMRINARSSWRTLRRDHSRTTSPNAGWPMSAAAGALDVQFTKLGHYQLGNAVNPLVPGTIDTGLRLMTISAFSWVILCFAWEVFQVVITTQA
jgi:adenosylcobinamide-phosphate synthase